MSLLTSVKSICCWHPWFPEQMHWDAFRLEVRRQDYIYCLQPFSLAQLSMRSGNRGKQLAWIFPKITLSTNRQLLTVANEFLV